MNGRKDTFHVLLFKLIFTHVYHNATNFFSSYQLLILWYLLDLSYLASY